MTKMNKTRKLRKTEAVDKDGRIWDKERLQKLILTSDLMVYKSLMLIYERQTADEQRVKATTDLNSIGFTGVDGEILSSFSEGYKKYGSLTPKQMAIARPKMKKYWRQLIEVIRIDNRQPERIVKL
jgi:hypothetical protein